VEYTEICVRGTARRVPSLEVAGRTIVVSGKWLKVAAPKEEDFQEGEIILDPKSVIQRLQNEVGLKADVLTFSQKLTDTTPRFAFPCTWESVAAIPVLSFADWWNNRVSGYLRKDVRRAAKRGIVVRSSKLTDEFVSGIVRIYDETPIRHGRPFWHYKKGFDAVKRENSSYIERSEFLGAFLGEELIGFLKIVYVDHVARLMQIISMDAHREARPTNALIAKAVEVCEANGCSHLTYGKYRYGKESDSLTAFKSRNGFEEILVPKYYVPLSVKGRLALYMHLHRGIKELIPSGVLRSLRQFRTSTYEHFPLARKVV